MRARILWTVREAESEAPYRRRHFYGYLEGCPESAYATVVLNYESECFEATVFMAGAGGEGPETEYAEFDSPMPAMVWASELLREAALALAAVGA